MTPWLETLRAAYLRVTGTTDDGWRARGPPLVVDRGAGCSLCHAGRTIGGR